MHPRNPGLTVPAYAATVTGGMSAVRGDMMADKDVTPPSLIGEAEKTTGAVLHAIEVTERMLSRVRGKEEAGQGEIQKAETTGLNIAIDLRHLVNQLNVNLEELAGLIG